MNSECNNCNLPEKIAESGEFETDAIKFDEWIQVDCRDKKFQFLLMFKKSLHALMHKSGH